MSDLRSAQAASDAFDSELEAVDAAYRAAVQEVPHATLRPDPYSGRLSSVGTADEHFVRRARRFVTDIDEGRCRIDPLSDLQEHLQLCRDLVAAADARDAALQSIDESLGWSTAHEHYDALTGRICDCQATLLNIPAPDGEALMWKVENLYTPGEGVWEASYEAQTHDDLRRLLLQGAA
jgi:hypothetical protein